MSKSPATAALGRACVWPVVLDSCQSLYSQPSRCGLQNNGKHWQLVILAHSMGNRPTTAALGKVYNDEKAALQLNTADLPMLVRLCNVHVCVCVSASLVSCCQSCVSMVDPCSLRLAMCNAARPIRHTA